MLKEYNKKIPQDALFIIDALEEQGYEAYVVGGCVRDMLMGREPNDWDITTSATPDQVKAVFKRTYDTGIAHGTVTVIVDQEHYEVTTYRIEGEYKDCRRPDHVSFVEDITLDLSRRDFTMNAIAYHPQRGFVDPYKGQKHIEAHCIKSVRDAKERFTEDALRILRAVRFAAQLGFAIDDNTIQGIKACRHLLANISKERIRDEFVKICMSDRPEYINTLHELKLLPYIIPEFEAAYETEQNHPYHLYHVAEHALVAMAHTPKDLVLRLTMLLHDIGKPLTRTTDAKGIDHFYNHPQEGAEIAKHILKDLRFDNQTIQDVGKLIKYHDFHITGQVTTVRIKEILQVLGEDLFDKLMSVCEADAYGQNLDKLQAKCAYLDEIKEMKAQIIANKECYNLKMLAITGKDLMANGIPKGKVIGEYLEDALKDVMKHPEHNKKEILLEALLKKAKSLS